MRLIETLGPADPLALTMMLVARQTVILEQIAVDLQRLAIMPVDLRHPL